MLTKQKKQKWLWLVGLLFTAMTMHAQGGTDLWIGGQEINSTTGAADEVLDLTNQLKATNVLKSGTVTFKPASQELTLNNAKLEYTGNEPTISFGKYNGTASIDGEATIVVVGNNTVTSLNGYSISANKSVRFKGGDSNTLNLTGGEWNGGGMVMEINSDEASKKTLSLTVEGPVVNIKNSGWIGLQTWGCDMNIAIEGGELNMEGAQWGWPAYFAGTTPTITMADGYLLSPISIALEYDNSSDMGSSEGGSMFYQGSDRYAGKVTLSRPDVVKYDIYLAGQQVTNYNATDLVKMVKQGNPNATINDDAVMSYDPSNGILSMKNVKLTDLQTTDVLEIGESNVKLLLEGYNTITTAESNNAIHYTGDNSRNNEQLIYSDDGEGHLSLMGGRRSMVADIGYVRIYNCGVYTEGAIEDVHSGECCTLTIHNAYLTIEASSDLFEETPGTDELLNVYDVQLISSYGVDDIEGATFSSNHGGFRDDDNNVISTYNLLIVAGRDPNKSYPLWIAGIQLTEKNINTIGDELRSAGVLTEGNVTFAETADGKYELCLDNATLTNASNEDLISNGKATDQSQIAGLDLNIKVKGDCTVSSNGMPIRSYNSLTFSNFEGEPAGTLHLIGIDEGGGLVIEGLLNETKQATLNFNGPNVFMLSNDWAGLGIYLVENCDINVTSGTIVLDCPDRGYPLYVINDNLPTLHLADGYEITPTSLTLKQDNRMSYSRFVDSEGNDYRGMLTISKLTKYVALDMAQMQINDEASSIAQQEGNAVTGDYGVMNWCFTVPATSESGADFYSNSLSARADGEGDSDGMYAAAEAYDNLNYLVVTFTRPTANTMKIKTFFSDKNANETQASERSFDAFCTTAFLPLPTKPENEDEAESLAMRFSAEANAIFHIGEVYFASKDYLMQEKEFTEDQIDNSIYGTGEAIAIGATGYATMYYNDDKHGLLLPAGVEAYELGLIDENDVPVMSGGYGDGYKLATVYTYQPEEVVGDAVPVILKLQAGVKPGTFYFAHCGNRFGHQGQENILQGSNEATLTQDIWFHTDVYHYKLAKDKKTGKVGFFWGAEDGGAYNSGAHKAWFCLPKTMNAASNGFIFDEDLSIVSGISDIKGDLQSEGKAYNLSGQRVSDSYRGIIIRNGKKIIK